MASVTLETPKAGLVWGRLTGQALGARTGDGQAAQGQEPAQGALGMRARTALCRQAGWSVAGP